MNKHAHLDSLLSRTRELFESGPTLVVRDSTGRDVQVVVDLGEAAWRTVQSFLGEKGSLAGLRAELGELSLSLPAYMVAAWAKIIWEETKVTDPEDLAVLADTVVYLMTELRKDSVLEYEEYDRWAWSSQLEANPV